MCSGSQDDLREPEDLSTLVNRLFQYNSGKAEREKKALVGSPVQ